MPILNKLLSFIKLVVTSNSGVSCKRCCLIYLFLLYGFVVVYALLKNRNIDNSIYYSLEVLIISCLGGISFEKYNRLKSAKINEISQSNDN